jgi:hypothetical protein
MKNVYLSADVTPNAWAVAADLDVGLITDLAGDDDASPGHTVYALGQKGEPAAGLQAFEVTPHFRTIDELERFCRDHRAQFEQVAAEEAWPDIWFWEQGPTTAVPPVASSGFGRTV